MEELHGHTLEYWKNNAEEDYLKVPISVLKYIICLEERIEQLNIPLVMLSLSELKQRYNKRYDEMIRCKKGKMMVWYHAEKKKVAELRAEIDRRKIN